MLVASRSGPQHQQHILGILHRGALARFVSLAKLVVHKNKLAQSLVKVQLVPLLLNQTALGLNQQQDKIVQTRGHVQMVVHALPPHIHVHVSMVGPVLFVPQRQQHILGILHHGALVRLVSLAKLVANKNKLVRSLVKVLLVRLLLNQTALGRNQ